MRKNKDNKNVKNKDNLLQMTKALSFGKTKIRVDLQKTLWLNTSTTQYSFANGGQQYYLNLIQELVATNSMDRFKAVTPSGGTVYIHEYYKLKSITVKFVPISVAKQVSDDLVGFQFRVFPSHSDLSSLPSGINGNYIPTDFDVPIAQLDKPITRTYKFANSPITSLLDIYKLITGAQLYNPGFFGQIAGILVINQTTPCSTHVGAASKIGYVEIDYRLTGYNLCT